MKQSDVLKKLAKIANDEGVDSVEFKQAYKEFMQEFGSPPPDRKFEHRPRGDQTDGERKKDKESTFPYLKRPSDEEI